MSNPLKVDVFGKIVLVEMQSKRWVAYYPGPDGKRRPALDIVIPVDIGEAELERYLADLCHEWATPGNQSVIRLTPK